MINSLGNIGLTDLHLSYSKLKHTNDLQWNIL